MSMLNSFYAAIIPMTIYLLILWRQDKYEREPFSFLIIHFLWGAVGAIILSIIGSSIFLWFLSFILSESLLDLSGAVIVAPIVEEIAKALILFVTYRSTKFDNVTDGMLYGAAVGLGFGMTENFLYFSGAADNSTIWLYTVILRTATSALVHAICTGIIGGVFGIFKFQRSYFKNIFITGFLIFPMLIHSAWNFLVSFDFTFLYGIIFIVICIIIFWRVYKSFINSELKLIREELFDELYLSNYIDFISSNKRFRKGWIDEKKRNKLITLSTTLAFRKNQLKKFGTFESNSLSGEIESIRDKIKELVIT